MRSFLFLAFLLFSLQACGSRQQDPLEAAGEVHLQVLDAEQRFLSVMDSLQSRQKPVSASASSEQHRRIQKLQHRYANWKANLIEVPGLEHDHSHTGGHSHDHASTDPQLTPEELLLVQRELLDTIRTLQRQAGRLVAGEQKNGL